MGDFSDLLLAVQARLQSQITYIRKGDIFITPDHLILPPGVVFPCIGIKDGVMEYIQETLPENDDRTFMVRIAAYQNLTGPLGELVVGKAGHDKFVGVVTLVESIAAALKDYRDIDGDGTDEMEVALPQASPESQLIETEKFPSIIMRTVDIKYTKYTG